jgi:outer membrane immunogenic protein
MKRLLLATTSLLGLAASPALAADMAVKARPMPCACECYAKQFDGWYVGVSGGGAKHIANRTDQDDFLPFGTGTRVLEKWGGIVGGQIGVNWAKCNTIWGFEVDGSWAWARNTLRLVPNDAPPGFDFELRTRFDSIFTARVRTGIAADNLLLYITGGLAAARFRTEYFAQIPGVDGFTTSANISEWRWGWVAGFGTEWAWSPNVSIKSEVLYANFADRERTEQIQVDPGIFFPSSFTHSDAVWISRVGLNYRWGGAPVAARY